MGELLWNLAPTALGIIASPLAILALVAVLVAERGRRNGIAFALGWVVGLLLVLVLGLVVFAVFDTPDHLDAPTWFSRLRVLLGAFMVLAAYFVIRRGQGHRQAMASATTPGEVAAAAPQLPGYLQAVSQFTFFRTFALGVGLFALNPVDASCALIAALDVNQAALPAAQSALVVGIFTVVSVLPVLVPVGVVVVRGEAARPMVDGLRDWVAARTNLLNAALLLGIGVIQIQKGISALIG